MCLCPQFEAPDLSDAAGSCRSNHAAAFSKRDATFFFILPGMFTSAWRKLRAKVGHAWDKCCYICQKNQTTWPAGTIHAHHVRGWEVSVWPDNCLQATVFGKNTPVYASAAHSIHNLFCSHSRLEWERASENFSHRFTPCYWTRTIFKIVVQKIHTGPNLLLCVTVAAQSLLYWIASSTLELVAPHFHHSEARSFATTSKEHINHAAREVTVNEAPTVADKIKLEHRFPWVPLRCPSGRARGLWSLRQCRLLTLSCFPPPLLNLLKPHCT